MKIDRLSLEIAARKVAPAMTFDFAMSIPSIKKAIESRAKRHQALMQRANDVKKKQANDED